ncbi:protein of unknown function [Pseudobutyrivibrio sp. YE44]|uniref:hypothetical protein n=1 Tax=Pseudobutyrivibrio sp. YE44 TaxID=1520802 RepID=UPI00088414C9|nr:hypothetical protein [Pseudobutyrivibrio sp. YE44]SDB08414.1 protein of unknown function [Pseudobutyrivibrio sp. YE44]
MKTNRIIFLTSVLCFSLLATGCGEPMTELTSEEEAIISLYSAKAVAKFNKNQIIGIANARVKKGELDMEYEPEEEEEIEGEENSEGTEPEIDPETGEPIVKSEDENQEESGAETGEGTQTTGDSGYSFTEAVGIDGVSFVCSEFNVTSEYKPTSSYILSKVSGKKYVVLNITATNESETTVDFSSLPKREYSLSLNGGEKSKSQFTPLTNDLGSFKGSLKAGESKSFVLVFLFSNSAVDNISSLELFVTSDGSSRETSI